MEGFSKARWGRASGGEVFGEGAASPSPPARCLGSAVSCPSWVRVGAPDSQRFFVIVDFVFCCILGAFCTANGGVLTLGTPLYTALVRQSIMCRLADANVDGQEWVYLPAERFREGIFPFF